MIRLPSVRMIANVAIVALPLVMFVIVARRAVDIPYWDEWELADLVYKMHLGTLHIADLWAQHNEHRMLFPNLIVLALARFGGWHPDREQFVSLSILVLTQIGVVALMRRTDRSTIGAFAALAASVLLFGLWQWENLGWGFQTAWFLCNACVVGTVVLLARPQRRVLHVVLALALAVIASFSSSQGLVVWAAGAAALLLSGRRGARVLLVWIPAGIVSYGVYRYGMFAVDDGHLNIATHPLAAVRYILAYCGAPLARWSGARASMIAGFMGLLALAFFFISDVRSPLRLHRLARNAGWYALASYPVLCAIATSAGRAGFGVEQGLASRYTSIGGLLWISIVGLVASRGHGREATMSRAQLQSLALAAVCFGFLIGASTVEAATEWNATVSVLRTARVELAASSPAALSKLYPSASRIIALIDEMRKVHDGPFGAP